MQLTTYVKSLGTNQTAAPGARPAAGTTQK
jgi:hypothetical protein